MARRAGSSAGRCPSRSPQRRARRPPRGGPACRPGSRRVTVTSIALFDDATIRPTIAISPSRSASSVVPRSITDRDRLVDVLAVAPRADVALRIEWRTAQRTGRAPGTDDPGRASHERSGGVGGHPHAQEVGAVLVLVVIFVR